MDTILCKDIKKKKKFDNLELPETNRKLMKPLFISQIQEYFDLKINVNIRHR